MERREKENQQIYLHCNCDYTSFICLIRICSLKPFSIFSCVSGLIFLMLQISKRLRLEILNISLEKFNFLCFLQAFGIINKS